MKKNMGGTDRLLRLIVAGVVIVLYFIGIFDNNETLGFVLLIIAAIFVLTSSVSFCPLYTPFGINTCKTKKE